jgi:hypothetical protein
MAGPTDPVLTSQSQFPSKSTFPDGLKTSGQHPPLYNELKSFEDFPEEIIGPTVWETKDYVNNSEKWIHRFSQDEIVELSRTADAFLESGIPLTGISRVRSVVTSPQGCAD